MTAVTVRAMTADDIVPAMTLAKTMHQESERFRALAFKPEKMIATFVRCITEPGHFARVATVRRNGCDVVAGLMIAHTFEPFFGDDRISCDYGIYTPIRGEGLGKALLMEYVLWAKQNKVKEIRIGLEVGIEADKVRAILKRFGFQSVGETFVHRG